jgi:DNA-directed RNA polymerase subunit RPC12/RpoP
MLVIARPAKGSRVVLVAAPDSPAIKGVGEGEGPLTYTCGRCGRALLEHISFEQVQNLVIQCGDCGAFNETAPVGEMN